jgi:hypothetical protein
MKLDGIENTGDIAPPPPLRAAECLLALSPRWRDFGALLTIALLAWGAYMVQPTVFNDDLWKCSLRGPGFADALHRSLGGRLEYYALYGVCMPTLQLALSLITTTFTATLLCRYWRTRPGLETVLVGGLYLTFPFFTDWYLFQLSHLSYNVGALFGTLALLWTARAPWSRNARLLASALLTLIALEHYQVILTLMMASLAMRAVIVLVRRDVSDEGSFTNECVLPGVATGFGVTLYAVCMVFVHPHLRGSAPGPIDGYARGRLSELVLLSRPEAVLEKGRNLLIFLSEVAWFDQRNYPRPLKLLMLLLVGLFLRAAFTRISKLDRQRIPVGGRGLLAACVLMLSLVAVLAPQLILLPFEGMPTRMRELVALSVAFSGMGYVALATFRPYATLAAVLMSCLIFGFVVMDNYEHTRRMLGNVHDFARVNRIVQRIEQELEDLSPTATIVIVGSNGKLSPREVLDARRWSNPKFAGKAQGDTLFGLNKLPYLFSFLLPGRTFVQVRSPSSQPLLQQAQEYARANHAWPARSSVSRLSAELLVVVINNSHLREEE